MPRLLVIEVHLEGIRKRGKPRLGLMAAFKRDFRNGDKHPGLKSEKLMHISDQCTHL